MWYTQHTLILSFIYVPVKKKNQVFVMQHYIQYMYRSVHIYIMIHTIKKTGCDDNDNSINPASKMSYLNANIANIIS